MIRKLDIKEITRLHIIDDVPMTPERQVRARAFALGRKLLLQHEKATGYAEELKVKHGAGSSEYQAMMKHRSALGRKGVAFSKMSWGQGATEEMIAELYPIQRPNIFSMLVNGQERELPATLQAITFEQAVGFALQYGNELEVQLKNIQAIEAGPDQQTALILWEVDKMYKSISFFAGIDLDALKNSGFDSEIASIYRQSLENIIDPINS